MTISRHTSRVLAGDVAVEPSELELSLNELNVPFAQARIVAKADPATMAALDPTVKTRVSVTMRQDFGTGETLASISADYAGMTLGDLAGEPENLLPNGSFDADLTGWVSGDVLVRDTTTFVDSPASCRIDGTPTDSARGMQSLVFPISAGGFIVKASARASDVNVSSIGIEVNWYDADLGLTLGGPGTFIIVDPDPDTWYTMSPWHAQPGNWPNAAFGDVAVTATMPSATDKRVWFDGLEVHVAYDTLLGLTARYGKPYNGFGLRPSTSVRANLMLRERVIDYAAGTVTILAASDEAALQDYSLTQHTAESPTGSTVRDCVNMVLARVLDAAVSTVGTGSEVVEADALPWLPGENAWSYLQSIVGSAGLRLWCDESALWHLDDPSLFHESGNTVLAVDSLAELTDSISRDQDWADSAVVTYKWTDSGGVSRIAYDASGLQGSKTTTLQVDRPYPGRGLAAAIVRKAKARVRMLGLNRVADYDVRPYQAAQVSVPDLASQAGVVAGVTWTQPADRMEIETRDIVSIGPNAYLATPAGVAYNEIAVGVSYDEYVWEG